MREAEKEEVKELTKGCSITSRKTGSCKMDLGSGRHLKALNKLCWELNSVPCSKKHVAIKWAVYDTMSMILIEICKKICITMNEC